MLCFLFSDLDSHILCQFPYCAKYVPILRNFFCCNVTYFGRGSRRHDRVNSKVYLSVQFFVTLTVYWSLLLQTLRPYHCAVPATSMDRMHHISEALTSNPSLAEPDRFFPRPHTKEKKAVWLRETSQTPPKLTVPRLRTSSRLARD